MFYTKMSFL